MRMVIPLYKSWSRAVINIVQKQGCPTSIARVPLLPCSCRSVTTTATVHASRSSGEDAREEKNTAITQTYFRSKERSKGTFVAACDVFKNKGPQLRGHVEFIYSALRLMEEYGVHKDLEVYKKLLDLMPKGKMIPRNVFQAEFMHYPKQQQCAIDCLEQMEMNGVMPDTEMEHILRNTFGNQSHPLRKYGRMMYWMPKFKNASPWSLPHIVPNDTFVLAKMAVARMCTVDPTSVISVYETKEVEDAIDDTWIVSGQSTVQQELLEKHPPGEPIKVEGPFRIYLRDKCIGYFILRAEAKPKPPQLKRQEIDDVSSLKFWFTGDFEPEETMLMQPISVHEQDDGTILAVCVTGTSGRDSLLSWIRLLERTNPSLVNIPVLFTQSSPIGEVMVTQEDTSTEVTANN